jgi:hypothetical protein
MENNYRDHVKSEMKNRLDELLDINEGCPFLGAKRQRLAEIFINEIIDDLFFEADYENL